jgi:hypothetical protein
MNSAVNTLLKEQCVEWQQCAENYAALETVEVRNTQIEGYSFKVQFNPKRIQSSAAKVDPKSIKERKCFLCEANRPAVQRGIPFAAKSGNTYTILVNPFPIFKKHLTIPAADHIDQRIDGKVADMLELAGCLTDYLIFYNGPKCGASAPDHFHFQAGNKGFLPIEMDIEAILSSQARLVAPDVYVLNNAAAHTIVCKSANIDTIICWFNQFYAKFGQTSNSEEEPMMNLLAWAHNGHYYLVVYPRKTHRPSQFFAEGDANILISPASIDLGGIFITPLEKDFSKLTDADIKDILQQITVTPDVFNKLIQ